jgi:hypothetical protein
LLDKLLAKEKEIEKAKTILAILNQKKELNARREGEERQRCLVDALLYRASLIIVYGAASL